MKTLLFCSLLLLAFSLESFRPVSGIDIRKRHYRKGYYLHICHDPKTQPLKVAQERVQNAPAKTEPVPAQAVQNVTPVSNAVEPTRAIQNAPVSITQKHL